MANPIYVAKLKIPMTDKPRMAPSFNYETYEDIFQVQNTIRLILSNFTEEAPKDGKQYAREDGTWTEVTGGGGGGGGTVYSPGFVYTLPGYTASQSSLSAATDNSIRGLLINAGDYGDARPVVVAESTLNAKFKFGLYRVNSDSSVGSLYKDLDEIVCTPVTSGLRYKYGSVPIGTLPFPCILACFSRYTAGTALYVYYTEITAQVPFTRFSTRSTTTTTVYRYDWTLPYPATLPTTLGTVTLSNFPTLAIHFLGIPP